MVTILFIGELSIDGRIVADLSKIFLNVVNMSIVSSWVILCILAVRLVLPWAPRRYVCILWYAALFRLLSNWSIPIGIGAFPVARPVVQEISGRLGMGIEGSVLAMNAIRAASSSIYPASGSSVWQSLMQGAFLVWILGMAGMLIYAGLSYKRLAHKLSEAEKWEGNVYLVQNLHTPFVLGIIRPRIYLPKELNRERRYVLLHERMHIRRRDPLLKAAACLALVLHWFNPLVWLAFWVLERDMECACDEAVLDELGSGMKKEYAEALLTVAMAQTGFQGIPLAFGEGEIKGRIRHILRYRKPTAWICVVMLLMAGAACLGFLLKPQSAALSEEVPSWLERAWEWRTPYTGNASAVGNITDAWYTMADASKDGFELYTDEQPYGVRIRFQIAEGSELDAEGICENYDSLIEENVGILFALVENLGYVELSFDGMAACRFLREDYEARYGNLWEQTETLEGLVELYEKMGE